jgi:hypothetical protein
MKYLYLTLFFLISPFTSVNAEANCNIVNELEEVELKSSAVTNGMTVCSELRNLVDQKTIIDIEGIKHIPNISYRVVVKNSAMRTLVNKVISVNGHDEKLELQGERNLYIYLTPVSGKSNYDFTFNIINYNEQRQFGVINITPIIIKSKVPPRIDPPCDGSICYDPKSVEDPIFSFGSEPIVSIMSTSASDASQCTDDNRPPHVPPINQSNGSEFNYNKALQLTEAVHASNQSKYTAPVAEVMAFLDMYASHKTGSANDVKSSKSIYYDGSLSAEHAADNGNFLYGGRMAAYGFSEGVTQRASAAYQAISDNGWWGLGQGVVNFVSNSGDNSGDSAVVSRGWKYKQEVQSNNRYDTNNSSCVDVDTKEASGGGAGAPGGGGGGGGEGGDPGDSENPGTGGGGGGGGGVWWCFVQVGYTPHCWME